MSFLTVQQIVNQCFDPVAKALRFTTNTTQNWEGVTTDATPTELFLSGGTDSYLLDVGSVVSFNLTIGAVDQVSGDALAYSIKGGIKRSAAGVVSLISSSVVKDGAKDDSSWDIDVAADDVNKSLKVIATGDAVNAVSWEVIGIMAAVAVA